MSDHLETYGKRYQDVLEEALSKTADQYLPTIKLMIKSDTGLLSALKSAMLTFNRELKTGLAELEKPESITS